MNDDDVLPVLPPCPDWPQPIEVRLFRAAHRMRRRWWRSRLGRRIHAVRLLWHDFWYTY